ERRAAVHLRTAVPQWCGIVHAQRPGSMRFVWRPLSRWPRAGGRPLSAPWVHEEVVHGTRCSFPRGGLLCSPGHAADGRHHVLAPGHRGPTVTASRQSCRGPHGGGPDHLGALRHTGAVSRPRGSRVPPRAPLLLTLNCPEKVALGCGSRSPSLACL